jgi:hypothetical protein
MLKTLVIVTVLLPRLALRSQQLPQPRQLGLRDFFDCRPDLFSHDLLVPNGSVRTGHCTFRSQRRLCFLESIENTL